MATISEALAQAKSHHRAGQLPAAEQIYRQILQIDSANAEVFYLLGALCQSAGRLDEAVANLRQAVRLKPDHAEPHNHLGITLAQQGNLDQAAASFQQALRINPDFADARKNLGKSLADSRSAAIVAEIPKTPGHLPSSASELNGAGISSARQGELDQAIASFRRAVQIEPDFAEAHNNLGNALTDLGKLNEAAACFLRTIELQPDFAEAHSNLGYALERQGKIDEAVDCYQRALQLQPEYAVAHNNLGLALLLRAQHADAIASFRHAIRLQPDSPKPYSNLLFCLQFCPDYDAMAIYEEHQRWNQQFAEPLAEFIQPHSNDRSPDRRLRVGYLSPNFRNHVVGRNLLPLFREHDRSQFDVVCYAQVSRPDAVTHRFQSYAGVWRNVAGVTDETLAALIREDGIDILVDLTLHMAHNRLLVFARKPAPVQVTFAGYPGTTGLSAIDYRFTDPYLDPPDLDDHRYSEESIRLPDTFWCYDPLTSEPAVTPLPALEKGYVTFGCLSNFCKINAPVLKLWAQVLKSVDHSRLTILAADGAHRQRTLDFLEEEGVAPNRVNFVAGQPLPQYLKLYHHIDIGLDTFPYNGHTTSLDSLWMGVPVITLVGYMVVGRAGFSQLGNLGLPELIADTPEQFVRIAVELAKDPPRLSDLRAALRDRMKSSPLMDAPRFARSIEAAYRTMWQRWCVSGVPQASSPVTETPELHNVRGIALAEHGQLDQAVACYRRALELKPDYAVAHNNLGNALKDQGKLDEAIACYRRALELKPAYAVAYNNLGNALKDQGKLDEAIACYRRALELKPDFAEAHINLGNVLKDQGELDEALACYRRALEISPDHAVAHANLLCSLQYLPNANLAALAAAHAEYERRVAAPLRAAWRPHDNVPDGDRPLKFGFLSPDLGRHPVGYFLIRVLENLDRREVEIVCYSDRLAQDELTLRLRAAATTWREVFGWSEERLAEQIRADRIDILFDLAGHTVRDRLLVFARKPAPIQVTWAGYVGTTGLKAMDYLLADRYEVPQGAERYYQERVLRMPDGYVTYDPPAYAPPVSPPPVLKAGYVTFGSFNKPGKITPRAIEVWATILRRVPGARLVLKYKGFDIPSVTRRFVELFAAQGVEKSRLKLVGWSPHPELLEEYNRIDLALDTFPYSGGLTTCEALWMGVPVITCPGETFAGRHSLSHLSNVGLTETIAGNLDQYVEMAVALAGDRLRLAKLRAELRQRMAASPLCGGKRFAENLMHVLRDAWREWCRRKPDYVAPQINAGEARADDKIAAPVTDVPQARRIAPESAKELNQRGITLAQQGKLDEAIASFRRAVQFNAQDADAARCLGIALMQKQCFEQAASSFQQLVGLKPNDAEAYVHLARAVRYQGKLEEAVAWYRRALELRPDDGSAHNSLGIVLSEQGKQREALACYRRAMELRPGSPLIHSNYVHCEQHRPGVTLAELASIHAEWDRRHAAPLRTTWRPHENTRDPHRRLCLGFISSGFRRHALAYSLVRTFEALDRQQCGTLCYCTEAAQDDMTGRFKAASDVWRDVYDVSDAALAEQIRADRVDILFDLDGHTGGNRLPVFARKPAPIQIAWIGPACTTGLSAMDYIIAGRWEVPAGAESHYREQVLRLPDGYHCYDPSAYAPPPGPLPALEREYVTFGCFNKPEKISSSVVAVWAKILQRIPAARLILKYRCFGDHGTRRYFEEMFAACGVPPQRLEMQGYSTHVDLLQQYNRVDLGLDTFTFSGCMTTCEALWMGVPVITWPGETFASRHSLGQLSDVGLMELVASDPSHYVELTVGLAHDLPRLAKLRAGLRERVAASPLCNGKRFAENLMRVLRDAWREWCGRGPAEQADSTTKESA